MINFPCIRVSSWLWASTRVMLLGFSLKIPFHFYGKYQMNISAFLPNTSTCANFYPQKFLLTTALFAFWIIFLRWTTFSRLFPYFALLITDQIGQFYVFLRDRYDVLQDCVWSDRIALSLDDLFYDVLQEDFEIFIGLEDK